MAASSQMTSLTIILAFGVCKGSVQSPASDTSFVIGDRKFDHVWNTKASMPAKRSDMSATTVGNAIYIIGGCGLDQVWVADPKYPEYRCGGTAANSISASTYRYNPASNTFETLEKAPRPRYRHAAAAVDNKVYLFGGTGSSGAIVPEVDVLDTQTGKWTTLAEKMPNPTTDGTAFAYNDKIFTVGGYDATWTALKRTQVFDPKVKSGSSWHTGPALNAGRGDTFAVVVDSTNLKGAFIMGGFTHENDWKMPIGTMEMMNVAEASSWTSRTAMQIARGDKAVAVLNNIIHVVGGETKSKNGHSVPLTDVEAYDPVGNKWYKGGEIPSHRFRFVAAAHGNSLFIFGGQGYLQGEYGKDGSKYPLMDTVEEYSESVSPAMVSAASGFHASAFAVVSVTLSMFVQTFRVGKN